MSSDRLSKDEVVTFVLNENITADFEKYRIHFFEILESVFETIHKGGYSQIYGASLDILPIILNSDRVYSEIPFTYIDNDLRLWNGIIDLIYEKDNRLHIIDWKTNRTDVGLAEHYKAQLNSYKQVAKQLIGKEVEDSFVYHINIKQKHNYTEG